MKIKDLLTLTEANVTGCDFQQNNIKENCSEHSKWCVLLMQAIRIYIEKIEDMFKLRPQLSSYRL